jgi:hypothetical protein
MDERKTQESGSGQRANEDNLTGKGKGMQGIDKAPGEEPSQDVEQVTWETQKGKKVDADPEKESDKPVDQEEY